jgi:hypothetical protein
MEIGVIEAGGLDGDEDLARLRDRIEEAPDDGGGMIAFGG